MVVKDCSSDKLVPLSINHTSLHHQMELCLPMPVLLLQCDGIAINCKGIGILLEKSLELLAFGNAFWLLHATQLGHVCLTTT